MRLSESSKRPKQPAKQVSLDRKLIPAAKSSFFARFYGDDWRRWKRYENVQRAVQAYEGLMKSKWNHDFEWRVNAEVGFIRLPVVKA